MSRCVRARMALAVLGAVSASSPALADPSGHKWFPSSLPVPYRVFAHSGINGIPNDFAGTVLPAVQNGFARWTSAQVSCTSWRSTYQGSFSSPSNASAIGNDGLNRVIWLGGADWAYSSATLGLTTTTYFTNNGQIIDADMEMNNGRVWKVAGNQPYVDVESIATHEAGHFLGLDHSAPTSAVMYANYSIGDIKRALTQTDITDVCTVYPSTTTGGAQGDPCTADSACGSTAPACRGAVGASSRICTRSCTTDSGCPTGYTCQNASPSGKACLPPVGSVDLCKFCTDGSQCSTGMCVTNGPQSWCTRTCLQDSDCGAGYACIQGTQSKVCAPTTSCGSQCTSNAQCAIGYACQGGTCTATGAPGDRCEISVYCQPCSVCILASASSSEAYCRPCCGGANGGGACNSCSSTSCQAGSTCYGVQSSNDAVCIPSEGASFCQACDATTPCESGLTCDGFRCKPACSITSPGSCSACYAGAGGQGLCACPDEVAQTGQACGKMPSGLRVCTTGNVCVGSPSTCRAQCTLGDDSTCPGGQVCDSVGGTAVCVPGNTPGQRCSSCENGGGCGPGLQCMSGRCYEPCTPGVSSCTSCVAVDGIGGVCACDDQVASPGQFCGVFTEGGGYDVYACAQGSVCLGGTCRLYCTPSAPLCPTGESCQAEGAAYVCKPWTPPPPQDAGTDPGPGNRPDGGSQNGVTSGGCGCSGAGSGGAVLFAALGLLSAARRRRCVSRPSTLTHGR